MRTGEVRESDSRGRHTTTHRALIALPSGACLIDTPGMRELKPTGEETLAEGGFSDIEALTTQCRFRDCAHQREPGRPPSARAPGAARNGGQRGSRSGVEPPGVVPSVPGKHGKDRR